MKRFLPQNALLALALLGLAATLGRADSGQISSERLDEVDEKGYFTPGFKAAVHALVETKHDLVEARTEAASLKKELPSLQKQADTAQARSVALREELARYEHPDETDFAALQKAMSDPSAKTDDQIALAQAYVWTYPTSPHASEAQQDLQQIQKKVADDQQAIRDAEAARIADHARLVQRAQAHDLSLKEWRDFLRDMSEDDLVKLIGHPTSDTDGYWIYSGAWVTDPRTNQKVGMQINLQAGRVLNVDEIPSPP
jgi:DNA repair exonuclease SbcCD ATPase subunit